MFDLDYYRTKRSYLQQAIDKKHNEWMEYCSQDDFCEEVARKISDNIDKLYEMKKQNERELELAKWELLKNA